jgi:biopolymer transport protein ExbB/TolQ
VADEERKEATSPPRAGRSSLSLLVYLALLTTGVWALVRFGLRLQLTEFLARAVSQTGAEWVMYLLIGLSILSVGVMLERWLFYARRAVEVDDVRARLEGLLEADEVPVALAWLTQSESMESRVAAAGLRHWGRGPATMEEQMLGTLARERLGYEARLPILGTLGNNAPFIGLFGTVLGIVKAFVDLSLDVTGGAATVMAGISEALVATAIGLLVAIPCVIAFNALREKVKVAVSNTELLARVVLAHAKQSPPGEAPGNGRDAV